MNGSIAPATQLRMPATGRSITVHLIAAEQHAETARALAAALEHPARGAGCTCCLYIAGDPAELPSLARAAARAAVQDGIVVAAGGDGSINAVAQAAWQEDVPMSALACGTFNFFAREHGLPEDPEAAASALLDTLAHGEARAVRVGRVNERVFLVNASLGLYPRILVEREQASRRFGRYQFVALASAIMTLARGVRRRMLTLSRSHDGANRDPAPVFATTLFAGRNALQLEQLGMPETGEVRRGALGIIVHKPESRWSLAALLLRAARGALAEHPRIESFSTRALDVTPAHAGGRHRVLVACDGETLEMKLPLQIRVEERPLRLLAPRDALAEVRPPAKVGRAA